MPIPEKTVEYVIERTEELFKHLRSIPFIDVTEIIEEICGCRVSIYCYNSLPIPCLGTCDEQIILLKDKKKMVPEVSLDTRHHFIFFRKNTDEEIEAFEVAHELGHCYLHWPLEKREKRLISLKVPELQNDMYMVRFNKKEECEADAFGCILVAHLYPNFGIMNINNPIDKRIVHEKIRSFGKRKILQCVRYKEK